MTTKGPHFHVFRSPTNHQWYWRLVARNGRVIAVAGEGYLRKSKALKDVEHIQTAITTQTTSVTVEE